MIFLVGQHCAGKTKIATILTRMQFLCIDLGPALREIHQCLSPDLCLADWIQVGEKLEGRYFTDSRLAEEISRRITNASEEYWQDVVIVGSRSLGGVRHLIERIKLHQGHGSIIVWIEAPIPTLYRRYLLRDQGTPLSYSCFLDLLEVDNRLGLLELRGAARWRMYNIGDERELDIQIRTFITLLGYSQVNT